MFGKCSLEYFIISSCALHYYTWSMSFDFLGCMIYMLDITATETYATACTSWLERNNTRINEIKIEKKKSIPHRSCWDLAN